MTAFEFTTCAACGSAERLCAYDEEDGTPRCVFCLPIPERHPPDSITWVYVTQALPELWQPVLMARPGRVEIGQRRGVGPHEGWWYDAKGKPIDGALGGEVYAWAPLPLAPPPWPGGQASVTCNVTMPSPEGDS